MTENGDLPSGPSGDGPGGLSRLRSLLALLDEPGTLVGLGFLSLVASLAEALAIVLVATGAASLAGDSRVAEVALGPIQFDIRIRELLVVGLSLTVVMVAARVSVAWVSSKLTSTVLNRARDRLMNRLLAAAWERQAATSQARFQDLVSVQALRIANIVSVAVAGISAGVAFAVMALAAVLVSPLAALVLIALAALMALAFRPITRHIQQRSGAHLSAHHDYVDHVANVFGVLAEVRVHGVGVAVARDHAVVNGSLSDLYRRMRLWGQIQPAVYFGGVLLLMLVGVAAASSGPGVDLVTAGAVALVMLRGMRYSQSAQTAWQASAELAPYAADMDSIIAQWSGQSRRWGDRALPRAGVLELDGVTYAYPSGEVGVSGVSLSVSPGEVVGLAGPSGAGKTTLAQILLGLRAPQGGTYKVDGVLAEEFEEMSWFARFGYVGQQPLLLRGDIAENVRFFRPEISDDDIAWALTAAAMDSDLLNWDKGLRRQVGGGGSELSGGQRQRVAIARALAHRPDVLVLDEPTSALDPGAERVIRETLERLRGQVTVILIAHRASTLEVCDRVVRMADGTAVEVVTGERRV